MTSHKYIITGGCGFIGHHMVEHFLKNTDARLVVIDKLGVSGTFDRLRDISVYTQERVPVFTHDLQLPVCDNMLREFGQVDAVLHLAAETHVDRSITDPEGFVKANVTGTMNALEMTRKLGCPFWYFSTDEVFGPAPDDYAFIETDAHNPKNPYAASKSAGEMLAVAWGNTYGMDCRISRTMNCYGERQHPEKFIPLVMRACLRGDVVKIHGDATRTKAGSRFWIHARSVADAYLHLLMHGAKHDVYHIVGEREIDNLTLATMVATAMNRTLRYEIVDFHSSRPGHDLRYAMADTRLRESGWDLPVGIEQALAKTVQWTLEHPQWLI